jgi:hypothetical protein
MQAAPAKAPKETATGRMGPAVAQVTVVAAISTGAVIAIVAGTIALFSVLVALVKLQGDSIAAQGDRIAETRTDLHRQIDTITGRIDQLIGPQRPA